MATKVRIALNSAGIRELLTSQAVDAECYKAAQTIKMNTGMDGFEIKPARLMNFGGGRVGYAVYTATQEAREAEAEDKVLSRAVRG